MGWSVKIGSSGQFTPVSGGLSIRFLHVILFYGKLKITHRALNEGLVKIQNIIRFVRITIFFLRILH